MTDCIEARRHTDRVGHVTFAFGRRLRSTLRDLLREIERRVNEGAQVIAPFYLEACPPDDVGDALKPVAAEMLQFPVVIVEQLRPCGNLDHSYAAPLQHPLRVP